MDTELQRNLTRRLLRFRSLPEKEDPVTLAEDLLKIGRYGDARGVAVSAQQGRADDVQLFLLEARAWYLERDLARAQAALIEAIRVDPECAEAYTWLGEVMLKRGDPERAVKTLVRALALDPENAQINRLCGRALRFSDIARSYSDELKPNDEPDSGTQAKEVVSPTPMIAITPVVAAGLALPTPPVALTPIVEAPSSSTTSEPAGLSELKGKEEAIVTQPEGLAGTSEAQQNGTKDTEPSGLLDLSEKKDGESHFSDRPTGVMKSVQSIRVLARSAIAPPEKPSGPARPVLSIRPVPEQSGQDASKAAPAPEQTTSAAASKSERERKDNSGLWWIALGVALVLALLAAAAWYFARDSIFPRPKPASVSATVPRPPAPTAAQEVSSPRDALAEAKAKAVAEAEEAALLQKIEQLVRESKIGEAKSYLSNLAQPARDSIAGRAAFARLALAQGRPVEAINALNALAHDRELSPAVSVIYGNALFAVGRVDDAAASYNGALRLDPELPEALIERAELAVRGEQATNALEFLDRAERSPKTAMRGEAFRARLLALKGRAHILRAQTGDFDTASQLLSQSIALKGAPAEAHFWLGEALAPRKPRAATQAFVRYLEIDPRGIYAARAKRALMPRE